MSFQVWSWVNGASVDDDQFDGHVVSSKPKRVKYGATVVRNVSGQCVYRGVTWEPDASVSKYVDSVDGWRCPRDTCIVTGSGASVIDMAKCDGGEVARIYFEWLRHNQDWCHGFMFEMIARRDIMGWQESPQVCENFYEAFLGTVNRRRRDYFISLNGRHSAFVAEDDLIRVADRNKLEGGLTGYFYDMHDSHDLDGGRAIESFDYWIERMAMYPSIFECFTEAGWPSEMREQHRRVTAALACLYDAIYIGHLIKPGHWNELNPWHECYDELKALGEPIGDVIRSAEIHSRRYENGILLVNPGHYEVASHFRPISQFDYMIWR